ncbi:S-phase kinase-associated protein 2-like isoform X2 [Aphelenchoides bicaudatus]|nr:S-phase kinase-associated protein 2-like isoform X2 [Aphelenchoides bicaudatus]
MSLCRRFYRIGRTVVDVWNEFDQSNLTIGHFALQRLLECRVAKMRLMSARIFTENLNYAVPANILFDRLAYLDLSYAVYTDFSILSSIMDRTVNLKYLNIACFPAITQALCHKIAKNKNLVYLNMEMCKHFNQDGILAILKSCSKLMELNLSWAEFTPEVLKLVCRNMPINLSHLSLSGMKSNFKDSDLRSILTTCSNLMEINLSDCIKITSHVIKDLNQFKSLKTINLSRCYGIEPMCFLELKHLHELDIYGCVTDDGVTLLCNELYPTQVNHSPLSTIARPSFTHFYVRNS